MRNLTHWHRQFGAGIVETMIGILIGMIVLLVIYNVLSLAESYKRTTIGVADAQTTGLFAQFVLGREIQNAGNGIATGTTEYSTCTSGPNGVGDWRLKPIPVLITDGGANNVSDGLMVFYSNTFAVTNPVLFLKAATTPAVFNVQSPNGFKSGDWVIVSDKVANCWLTQVTAAPIPDAANSAQGGVDVSYLPAPGAPVTYPAISKILNLGQDNGQIDRVQYTVNAAKTELMSQVVNPAPVAANNLKPQPINPLAQNIVLMKAQYGIDPTDTNIVTFWTSAIVAPQDGVDYSCNNSSNDALFASCNYGVNATAALIRRVKAVRIAIVVKSDEFDKDPALVCQPSQYLFNCSANTNAACQGRIKIDAPCTTPGGVLADNYRYKTYETTLPLRNLIWNK